MHFQDNKEWSLNLSAFLSLTRRFYFPEIDLFDSRLNHVVPKFVSYRSEPGVWAADAFSLNWHSLQFYAFPHFSIIGKVLIKDQTGHSTRDSHSPFIVHSALVSFCNELNSFPVCTVKSKEGSFSIYQATGTWYIHCTNI